MATREKRRGRIIPFDSDEDDAMPPPPPPPAKPAAFGRPIAAQRGDFCPVAGGCFGCPIKGCGYNQKSSQYCQKGFINQSHVGVHQIVDHGVRKLPESYPALPETERVKPETLLLRLDTSMLKVPGCGLRQMGNYAHIPICKPCYFESKKQGGEIMLRLLTPWQAAAHSKQNNTRLASRPKFGQTHTQTMTLGEVIEDMDKNKVPRSRLPSDICVWDKPTVTRGKRSREVDRAAAGAPAEGQQRKKAARTQPPADDGAAKEAAVQSDLEDSGAGAPQAACPDSGRLSLGALVNSRLWDPAQVPQSVVTALLRLEGDFQCTKTLQQTGPVGQPMLDMLRADFDTAIQEITADFEERRKASDSIERLVACGIAMELECAAAELAATREKKIQPLLDEVQRVEAELRRAREELRAAEEVRVQHARVLRQLADYNAHVRVEQRYKVLSHFNGYIQHSMRPALGSLFSDDMEQKAAALERRLKSLPPKVADPGPPPAVPDAKHLADSAVTDNFGRLLDALLKTAEDVGIPIDITPAPSPGKDKGAVHALLALGKTPSQKNPQQPQLRQSSELPIPALGEGIQVVPEIALEVQGS